LPDAFEAMTSDRPYRRGCDPVAALSELRRHSGTQFDSDIVDAFEIVLEREGYLLAGAPQVAPWCRPSRVGTSLHGEVSAGPSHGACAKILGRRTLPKGFTKWLWSSRNTRHFSRRP